MRAFGAGMKVQELNYENIPTIGETAGEYVYALLQCSFMANTRSFRIHEHPPTVNTGTLEHGPSLISARIP